MDHGTLINQLTELLGGNEPLAAALDRDFTTVSRWKTAGIPAHMWHRVAKLAGRKGIKVSVETLARTSPVYGNASRSKRIRQVSRVS
jgi:hypothetical protein